MNENPLISIIVPIYNVEKYLERCIDSLLRQTYKNIEIILVDDGSTDHSPKMIDEYQSQNKKIKVIHQKNGGLSNARNNGLEIAKGEYIAFIDSDDYISDDYIEYLYKLIEENNSQMSICNYKLFSETLEIKEEQKDDKVEILKKEEVIDRMLYQEIYYISAWAKLYKKVLFEKVRYPEGEIYEDLGTTYKIVEQCERIACGQRKNYYYYVRDDSITKQKFSEKQFDLIKNTKKMTQDILKWYPEKEKGCIVRNMHAYISTYCRLINSEESYEVEKKEIEKFIKENRRQVLKNKKAQKRDKMALILFCFGEKIFKIVWNFYRKKKYKTRRK